MHYHYPYVIAFLDSITNVILVFLLPSLILFVGYIVHDSFVYFKKDNKIINRILILILVIIIVFYFYYSFFVLDYFTLLKESIISFMMVLSYIAFSPFILMYLASTSMDIEKSLFLHSDFILNDIKMWFDMKFGMDISNLTKESLLLFFKLFTLLMFSSKIINVTRFLISSGTVNNPKINTFIALVLFVVFLAVYINRHFQELLTIINFISNSLSVMLYGEMK